MIERFKNYFFNSSEELKNTLHRYIWFYNQKLTQSILDSKTLLQSIKINSKLSLNYSKKTIIFRDVESILNKPLTYCLLVTEPPYGTQKATNAWQFANALIIEGHILKTVFFYQEGVYNGNQLILPANDEFNLLIGWKTLAKQTSCQLNVCVSAALRRGIINETEAKNSCLPCANLDEDFVLTGLGALAEAMIICDRIVQF